jgi:DNA-binding winged helix-turn-helix (wHTH) protein
VPAAELAEKIWRRPRNGEYSSIVSTSMKNLRDKLQPLTHGKALIETFPRRGYVLHN